KEDIQSVVNGLNNGLKEQLIAGVSGSARSMLVSIVQQSVERPVLLITHQLVHAQELYDDLVEFIGEENVHLYPVNELIASEIAVASPELRSQRIDALTQWSKRKNGILVAPIAAVKRILPPPDYWEKYQLPFTVGEEINIENYLTSFVDMGYERVSMVTTPGEFSVRGGIIDIYPITEEHPIRVELFDNEVDSIRYFDADTQRSLTKEQSVIVQPASELLLTEEDLLSAANRLEDGLQDTLSKMKNSEKKELLIETIEYDVDRLKNFERFQEMYKYIGYFYEKPASLLDYLPQDGIILLDEMNRIHETAVNLDKEEAEWYSSLLEAGKMIQKGKFSYDWESVWSRMHQPRLYMSVFLRH